MSNFPKCDCVEEVVMRDQLRRLSRVRCTSCGSDRLLRDVDLVAAAGGELKATYENWPEPVVSDEQVSQAIDLLLSLMEGSDG